MKHNYYDEIYLKIEELYQSGDFNKATFLLEEELNMPYIPKDFEDRLLKLKLDYQASSSLNKKTLDEEEIEEYLKGDAYKQLIAVNYLDTTNLRENLELIKTYLVSDGDLNAKVLLISSLINQDINEELCVLKDGLEITFIPRYCESVEISDGYQSGKTFLEETIANDNPSLYNMALEMLTRICFLNLPLSLDSDEGLIYSKSIMVYLYDCFDDDSSKKAFIDKYVKNPLELINLEDI